MSKTNIVWIWVIAMILLASIVNALGVAPARRTFDFEPGLKETVEVKIINNNHKDFKAAIYARGELADYIKLSQNLVLVSKDEARKSFTYTLELPEDIGKPGIHEGEIIIIELPETFASEEENMLITDSGSVLFKSKSQQSVIAATTAVISQVRVNVPYPGKYAEAKLFITAGNVGEPVDFTIPVYNLGTQDLSNVSAAIDVLGPTNERLFTINTNTISIKAKEQGKLTARLAEKLNPGYYHAVVRINYDGKMIGLEGSFYVGELVIEVSSISVAEGFRLGEIAKLDILLENRWNQRIGNIYGDVTVLDKQGKTYSKFKTASIDLEPYEKDYIHAYWNTEGVEPGSYDVNIALHYAGKLTEKLFEIQVGFTSITTKAIPVGKAVAGRDAFIKQNSILILAIIVLLAINIGWLLYFKRKGRK